MRVATSQRSFAAKLWRYRAFLKTYQASLVLGRMVVQSGVQMPPGLRVLVVAALTD